MADKERTNMNKLKIGIIGCGGIANGKHMPSLAKVAECEMVAFCDLIIERAEEAAKKYGTADAKVYTDYKELLRDESIDVVHVLTPNRAHSFITVDALEAGKHVMCEKPMAINSAEAKKMLDAAKRTGKKLTIGYQNRQCAESRYLKMEAEQDTFGHIYYARAMALRRRGVPTWGVFLSEEEQGGGPLIDIATHSLDLTLWILDNYEPAYCVGKAFHALNDQTNTANAWGDWDPEKFTVEDSAFGFVVMKNGAVISVESSWALNTIRTDGSLLLCGTKAGADTMGGITINGVRNGRRYVYTPDMHAGGVAFYDGIDDDDASVIEAKQWILSIINDTEPCVRPEQAYVVTRILEGIYESSKTGDIYRFD